MFVFSGTTSSTQSPGAPLIVYDDPSASTPGVPLITYDTTPDTPLAVNGTLEIPSYTEGEITIAIPDGVETITSVAIGSSSVYTPATNPGSPQSGEFVSSGGNLVIQIKPSESPVTGSTLAYSGLSSDPGTTDTSEILPPYDSTILNLAATWAIEGELNFNRSFRGHPSASFQFKALASDEDAIVEAFRNKTPIQIYGMPFQVAETTIDYLSKRKYPDGWIEVSVSLEGGYTYKSTQPVKPIKAPALSGWTKGTKTTISMGQIANLAGLSYRGLPLPYIVEKDLNGQSTTTLEDAISDQELVYQGFVFWSNPNGVEVRSWGNTTTHYLAEADVYEVKSKSRPGKEFIYQGTQLVDVYKNSPLTLDQDDENRGNEDAVPLLPKTICDPAQDPSIPPEDVTDLRDPGRAFDNGGVTKTQRCTKYIGDAEIEFTEVTYGFAFAAIDVYYLAEVPVTTGDPPTTQNVKQWIYDNATVPGDFWIPVKVSRGVFKFDGYGYKSEIIDSGTETRRLKSEGNKETLDLGLQQSEITDQIEAGGLNAQQIADLNAQYNKLNDQVEAYHFNYVIPSTKVTTYNLAPFSAYYPDVATPQTDENLDPFDFIPPKFCLRETVNEQCYVNAPDPASTDTEPLPSIGTGRIFLHENSIQIVNTQKGQELHYQTKTTNNTEGTDLRDALAITVTDKVKGRPNTHDRSDVAITLISNLPGRAPTAPVALTPTDPSQVKYLLNVEGSGYPADGPEQGGASYNIGNPETARAAAECEMSINNTQSAETLDITCKRNLAYQEGDRLWFKGVLWVVFDVGWTEKIESGMLTCEGMQLKVGKYLRPVVTLTKAAQSN